MRILIPLEGLSIQVERIIACVAAELVASHQAPSTQNKFVKRVAKKLTAMLASYLSGEVAAILSPVAAIDHREMVPPLYQPLVTPVYWIRPIYTELLHAASRIKKDTRTEVARPSNGLVKIICSSKALGNEPVNATADNKGIFYWLGSTSYVQALYVWVPAHWATCICAVVKERTMQHDARREQEAQAALAYYGLPPPQPQRQAGGMEQATTIEGVGFFMRGLDPQHRACAIPTLVVSQRAPWLQLPVATFVNSMNTVYEGVLNGIIRQMPIAAWFGAPCKKIQLTIVLPASLPLDQWQDILVRRTSCWPIQLPQEVGELRPPSKETLLFLTRNCSMNDEVCKGRDQQRWDQWKYCRSILWFSRHNNPPRMALQITSWIQWGQSDHLAYVERLRKQEQQQTQAGRFKTRKGYWQVKRRNQTPLWRRVTHWWEVGGSMQLPSACHNRKR